MNPSDSQQPLSEEQIRQRREEAARRQQMQLRQQTQRIEQQRMLVARQGKNSTAAGAPTARSTGAPAPAPVTAPKPPAAKVASWTKITKAAGNAAPPPARTQVPAAPPAPPSPPAQPRPVAATPPAQPRPVAHAQNSAAAAVAPKAAALSPRSAPVVLKMKVAPLDLPPEQVGAAAPNIPAEPPATIPATIVSPPPPPPPRRPPPQPQPMIEEVPEIEVFPAEMEMPVLRLAPNPKNRASAELPPPLPPPLPVEIPAVNSASQELPPPLPVEIPEVDIVNARAERPPPWPVEIPAAKQAAHNDEIDGLGLDLVCLPDVICPKCQAAIPESHQGSFYTACPKCGEIIKMK